MTRRRGPERLHFVRYSMSTLRIVWPSQYFIFVFINNGVNTSLTTNEMDLWGTVQPNSIEAYLFPDAKMAYGQGKLQVGPEGLPVPCMHLGYAWTHSLRSSMLSRSIYQTPVAFQSMASPR